MDNRSAYLEEFKIFRNDTLIKTVKPKHHSEQIIKDLKFGKYEIEYLTQFKKTERKKLELTEKKTYEIDLCIDYINYELESYKPFIDRIKNGESYSIEINSSGCFHRSEEKITISRNANKYYIRFAETEKLLKDEDIDAIRCFEIELNYMESWGCTSVDDYVLKYKNNLVKISDGSCSWNGGGYLSAIKK
ncbi:hypothetical protein [Psychroserpens algicola]|uniref:CYTH domain-containing protein n=1 Tax=Psychroserpens algicola TaxID=1719034 RepID=A0ABT0HD26_9FLAO|nr:hypothetical protein [Psychroserpens algicola]MCK8482270.1 hypothetical protein [Psychroserpens algicola]